ASPPPHHPNAECGMRNAEWQGAFPVTARPPPSIPHSEFRIPHLFHSFRTPHSALRTHSPAPVSYLRSITRVARRLAARSYLRFSSGVSGTIGGTSVGTPLSSSAT